MAQAHDLVAHARALLGARFAHQGRTRDGLDCLGLLLMVADAAGLTFDGKRPQEISLPNYSTRPDSVFLQTELARFLTPVHAPQVGDVALLMIDGAPQHLAILSDYPAPEELGMIHAYAVARKVVEHRYDEHWRKATKQIYRLPIL